MSLVARHEQHRREAKTAYPELAPSEAKRNSIVLGKQSPFYASGEILRLRCAPAQNHKSTMTKHQDETSGLPRSMSHAASLV